MKYRLFRWGIGMEFFRNFRILTQVMTISAAAVAGIAAIAAASLVGWNLNDSANDRQREVIALSQSVSRLQVAFLEVRLAATNFLLNADVRDVDRHAQIVERTRDEIEKLQTRHKDEKAGAVLDQIGSAFDAYVSKFDEVVRIRTTIGLTSGDGLRADLDRTVKKVEGVVAMRSSPQLDIALLRMRRADLSFLTSNDLSYLDQQKRHLDGFLVAVGASLMNSHDEKVIADLARAYRTSTESLAAALLAEAEAITKLDDLHQAMAPPLQELLEIEQSTFTSAGQAIAAEIERTYYLIFGAIIVVATITVALGLVIGPTISRPLQQMTAAMAALAAGDHAVKIPARNQGNEIGRMATALQVFKDSLIESDRLKAHQQHEQSRQKDRSHRIETAIRNFDSVIGEVVAGVGAATGRLEEIAAALSTTAGTVSRQSDAVAAATSEMSRNIHTVASAAEQLSSSITEISGQVTESVRIVGGAVAEADQTNDRMKQLSQAAQKIGAVVTLINEIASQTNLLALNATIEAARAGEAGKGFAVVAAEVKSLAMQTGRATEDIGEHVRTIRDCTTESAHAIDSITRTISSINDIAATIAAAVEQQGAATKEISRNVQRAALGTSAISENITGVSETSRQTSAGSDEVLRAVSNLANSSGRLKREVDAFLNLVRAL